MSTIHFLLATLVTLLSATVAQAQACEAIRPREGGGAVLGHPGSYCLDGNMLVDSKYTPFAHGANVRGTDRILLLIAADEVLLDLRRHTIEGNASLRGAIETPRSDWQNFPDAPAAVLPKNLTIRNGSIRLTRHAPSAIGIRVVSHPDLPVSVASDLLGRWNEQHGNANAQSDDATSWAERIRRELPQTASAYPARGIRIEHMNIRSRDVGIVVEGAGTIIRNSTIEVDTGTAIWIYGPNALIENNTIIVNGDYQVLDADAPVRLHHGGGAIVRNNRIVVRGKGGRRAVAVFDTGSFVFENNIVYGVPGDAPLAQALLGTLALPAATNPRRPAWKAGRLVPRALDPPLAPAH